MYKQYRYRFLFAYANTKALGQRDLERKGSICFATSSARYICLMANSICFRFAQTRYDINPSRPAGHIACVANIEFWISRLWRGIQNISQIPRGIYIAACYPLGITRYWLRLNTEAHFFIWSFWSTFPIWNIQGTQPISKAPTAQKLSRSRQVPVRILFQVYTKTERSQATRWQYPRSTLL